MSRSVQVGAGTAALALASLLVAPAAAAQTTSSYSGTGDTAVLGTVGSTVADTSGVAGTGVTTGAPSTLPFTGGEMALVAVAGTATAAAGAGLLLAGRRRSAATR